MHDQVALPFRQPFGNLLADAESARSYFVAETMGRSAGWLAYGAAILIAALVLRFPASAPTTQVQTAPPLRQLARDPFFQVQFTAAGGAPEGAETAIDLVLDGLCVRCEQ